MRRGGFMVLTVPVLALAMVYPVRAASITGTGGGRVGPSSVGPTNTVASACVSKYSTLTQAIQSAVRSLEMLGRENVMVQEEIADVSAQLADEQAEIARYEEDPGSVGWSSDEYQSRQERLGNLTDRLANLRQRQARILADMRRQDERITSLQREAQTLERACAAKGIRVGGTTTSAPAVRSTTSPLRTPATRVPAAPERTLQMPATGTAPAAGGLPPADD